jgi:23S rRNA (pseudouridine1915-N3)-methyltransferase
MERLHLVAVAARLPAWVETGCQDYLGRLPREYALRRVQVKPEARTQGLTVEKMLDQEARRIGAVLPPGARIVALDERGRDLTTTQLAHELRRWLDSGTPTVFLIGGPDGLEAGLKARADSLLRLSSLTLPHALAQLLLLEQLYRAASLLTGHPYHRA